MARRGEKFEGVCLKHGEQLHYKSNGKCLVCAKGWEHPYPKDKRREYMQRWLKVRKVLGKKVSYGTKEAKRKRNKKYARERKERKVDVDYS